MKQPNLSLKYMVIVIINTFTFIAGLFAFLNSYHLLATFCLLVISLLNIYQLILVKPKEETVAIPEENEIKWEYLKEIQDLTEENQAKNFEIETLKLELEKARTEKTKIASGWYNFSLSSTTSIDVNAIFADCITPLKKKLSEKNIICTYTSTYDGSPIFLSLSAINVILNNLFDNVIKFTPAGGNVLLNLANSHHGLLLIIKNTSNALSQTELEHIFCLNYQGQNKQAGTGLGLTQVHAIVSDYGGSIYAKCNQDTGFTIYIELPQHKTITQQADSESKEGTDNEE